MKHSLVRIARSLMGMALVLLGLGAYGCGDSATENPEATLANLSVSIETNPATLQPPFNPATTSYTVDLSNNVTTVTVGAQPTVAGDSVTIDGQATTSRGIDLGPSVPVESTKLVSVVVSNPPSSSRTYTVLLKRAGLAGNNSLATLLVSPGTLNPPFNANTQTYTVDVANTVGSVTVTPALQDAAATMTVNGQPTNSGQARTITLGPAGQPTNIPIVVTAQNGNQKTYTVTVSRGIASNNNLSALTLSPGTLNPPFNANTQNYTVDVASSVASVTVTPRVQDAAATMTVNGQPTPSGQARAIPLNGAGSNTLINIVVTAQNGNQKPYTVEVRRAALGGNNNLSALTLSPGTLNPPFNANTQNYTVDVASSVASVTVTPRVQDAAATMTVNGQPTPSGQARAIPLNGAGSVTSITIVVTAQNGSPKAYTVSVNRAALGGNNNLSALTLSPGTLNPPFNANTLNYTVDVASSVASVTVTPRVQDAAATMTVNGQPTPSGQARAIPLNGAGSNTLINIVVTAQNGTSKTYFVTVNRAALGGNNNLSALTLSPGTLNPPFNANTLNYTVDVASSVASVTVTPRVQDAAATMTVNGQPTPSGQARAIPLNGAGSNTLINIVVTAQNGSQKPYTVEVRRAALGGNNNLQSLTVSPGTLSPTFRPDRVAYTVNVASNIDSLTVTPTVQDAGATLTINGQGATSGQPRVVPLGPAGSTTEINVTVIAPNGNPKTYQIDVNRSALGGNNNLSGLTVSPGSLDPAFDANTTDYTVNVGSAVTTVTVTATLQDTAASMTINGQGTSSGQPRDIGLGDPGTSTDVLITVTAPNGSQKTYTITINRSAATPPPPPANAPDLHPSSDSGISDSDNITNDLTPSFILAKPAAGETADLYVGIVPNPRAKVPTTESPDPADATKIILTLTNPLDSGEYDISVASTVTNAAGLESGQSPSLTVRIDNIAPQR